MRKIRGTLTTPFPDPPQTENEQIPPPLAIPKPHPNLYSKRVLVMELLDGVPLSRSAEEMKKLGVKEGDPETKLFARRLLRALTDAFGRCILETGFFHADPHPGNI